MTQRTIKYGIAFDVDTVSLQKIEVDLKRIMNASSSPTGGLTKDFQRTKQVASDLYQILRKCYNQDLGSLNVAKFNQKLKESKISLNDIQSLGPSVFNRLGMAVNSAKLKIKETSGFMSNIAKTLMDSAKWSIAYGLINKVSQSFSDAVSYVKELDTALNDIRIVTGKSQNQMEAFAQSANKAAIALGASTKDYADASLIYYQQGLSDEEVKERARITTMAANVTGQGAGQVSELLTAIWNGYKVSAAEAELYIDKVAAVAAKTGADLNELATGMSKVASAANLMGVDVDELNAQLATVITVTRQAPESVGTAFKTIYARINAIAAGSEDAEVSLKQYTADMLDYGISVLDTNGKLRDTGDVMAEIGAKWSTMTKEQQLGLAQVMAGQRQYNNLLALFDNWDMNLEALKTSAGAIGTLQEQQDIYMERTAAHIEQMEAKYEALYSTILNTSSLNTFYDVVGNIASVFDNMLSSFGGGLGSLVPMILSIASLFSKNIANGIFKFVTGLDASKQNLAIIQNQVQSVRQGVASTSSMSIIDKTWAQGYEAQLGYLKQMHEVRRGLTQEQQNEVTEGAARIGQLEQEVSLLNEVTKLRATTISKQMNEAFGLVGDEALNISGEGLLESRAAGMQDDALAQMDMAEYETRIQLTEKELATREKIAESLSQSNTLLQDSNQLSSQELSLQESLLKIEDEDVKTSLKDLQTEKDKLSILNKQLGDALRLKKSEDEVAKIKQQIKQQATNIKNAEEQVRAAVEKSAQATQKQVNKQREALNNAREFKKEVSQTAQEYARSSAELSNLKTRLDEIVASGNQLQAIASGVMGVMGSVSSLAMGWQMVSSVTETLNDQTASLGDKITQVLLSLSMGIPMILNGLKQLGTALGFEAGLIESITALRVKHNAQKQLGITLTKASTAESILESITQGDKIVLDGQEIQMEQLKVLWGQKEAKTKEQQLLALFSLSEAELAEIGVDKASIDVTLAKIEVLKKEYEANELLKKSVLGNPYTLAIMLAIAAAVGTIAAIASNAAKDLENTIAEADKLVEAENKYQASLTTHDETYSAYAELYDTYVKTGVATQDLTTKQLELIAAYGIELTEIEKLTLGYEDLQKKIYAARKERIFGVKGDNTKKGLLKSAQDELAAAEGGVWATARKGNGQRISTNNSYYVEFDQGHLNIDYVKKEQEIEKLLLDYFGNRFGAEKIGATTNLMSGSARFGISFTIGMDKPDQLIKLYDELVAAQTKMQQIKNYTDSDIYKSISAWIDKMTEKVDAYRQAVADVDKYSLQATIFENDLYFSHTNLAEFTENFNTYAQRIREQLAAEEGVSVEEISTERAEAAAREAIQAFDSSYSEMLSKMDLVSEIMGTWRIPEDKKAEFKEELQSLIGDLSTEEIQVGIKFGLLDAQSAKDVEAIVTLLQTMSAETKLKEVLGYSQSAIESLSQGVELTEAQLSGLQGLEQQYSQLAKVANTAGRESTEYLTELITLREAQEEVLGDILKKEVRALEEYIDQIIPALEKAGTKIVKGAVLSNRIGIDTPEIDTTGVTQINVKTLGYNTKEVERYAAALSQLNDKYIELYKNTVQVQSVNGQEGMSYADLASDMSDFSTYAQKAAEAVKLIGEGFIVAAKDAGALLDKFPELAEGAEVLASGEIKLNEQVTKAVISGEKEGLVASLNAKKAKIQANKMEAETDLKMVEAALANEAWKTKGTYDELMSRLVNNTNYNEAIVDESETAAEDIVANHTTVGEQTVQMWQAVEQAVDDYAKDVAHILANPADPSAYQTYVVQTYEYYLQNVGGASSAGTTQNSFTSGGVPTAEEYMSGDEKDDAIAQQRKENLEKFRDFLREIIAQYTSDESQINNFMNAFLSSIGVGDGTKKVSKPDYLDPEEEIDRYYDINQQLKQIRLEKEKLADESADLLGEDYTENLKKQNELIDEENDLKRQGLQEAKKEASEIQEKLSGYGVLFDEETGAITNYGQIMAAQLNKVNAAKKALYDAQQAGITEGIDGLEQAVTDAKAIYDLIMSLVSRYDTILYSEIPEWETTVDYVTPSFGGGDSGEVKLKIEADLDIFELRKKWREFEREMRFEEGAFGSIVSIAEDKLDELKDYYGEDGIIAKLTSHLQTYLPDDSNHNGSWLGDDPENLEKYLTELMDTMEDAEKLIREIKQAMVDLMKDAQEAFDTQTSRYEALNGILEHNINLLNLLDGEENNYAAKQAFYDQQTESYISQLGFNRQQVEFWKEQLALAEEGSEAAEEAEKNLIDAIENSQSTLEEAIEHAQAAHINSIRSIFEELEDQITGGKGLAQLNKEWELIKGNADFYLDDVNKAYELSKLEANYRKSIDESSSTSAQRQLNVMMNAELSMLKEKDKLTQYDIDRANLKYQLTLKQIALEDAQKNKSTMRLKRDANGNYSYQYVADSSATASLEQEIADLNNQIHNLDKNALRNNLDEFLQLYQKFQEEMIAIEEAGGTEEEKEEKRLALRKLYGERANDLLKENNHLMQQLDQKTIKAIQGHWDIGIQNIIDLFNGNGGFEEVVKETYAKIDTESYNFQNIIKRMADAAGKDLDAIYKGFDKNLTILQPLIDKNKDLVQIYDEEMVQMWGVVDALKAVVESYSSMRDIAWDAAEAAKAHYEAIAALGTVSSGGGGLGGGYTPTPNPKPDPNPEEEWTPPALPTSQEEEVALIISAALSQNEKLKEWTRSNTDPSLLGYMSALEDILGAPRESAQAHSSMMNDLSSVVTLSDLEQFISMYGFDTGGYTGEWTNGDREGRLAFLHQKELVLNSADTANFLKAVDIVRSLDMSLMNRMAGMLGQIGLRSLGAHTPESAPIEQNVHIDAHFPGVSSAQEIQEAFDQLADQLGQMLYQNKK